MSPILLQQKALDKSLTGIQYPFARVVVASLSEKHYHTPMSDEYDSPWKNMLEHYFQDFMAFFFPQAHSDIDWTRGYQSLDGELQKALKEAEIGKRLTDKLMQVWRRNGEAQVVLVHIEVQGYYDAGFAERMFIYHYRLYDRYQTHLWGSRVGLEFPVVKLIDYQDRWDELEASRNPFAIVVMAHLQTRATRKQPENRLQWKFRLVKRL